MKNQGGNRQILSGYLFAIGATAIWSGNFIIARGLNDSIPPVTLAFWRWVVAALVFLPFAARPLISERNILKKHLPYLSLTAFLGVTVFNTLIYFAAHTTTAVNLSLISITFPIYIIILSRILYGEQITINKGVGILLVATGVILLVTRGMLVMILDISFAIGDLWVLLAAITFALYSLMLRRRPAELSIWSLQLSTFMLGLLFLFPFFVWEQSTISPVPYDGKIILAILYVGIFASLCAFLLWNKAIVAIGPSKAGMVYYTLPVFCGLLAYLFLGEGIGLIHLCSVSLILAGILTANYEPRNRRGN